MTAWLIHGFNVSDGGRGSIGKLMPYLDSSTLFSYGYAGPFTFGIKNKQAIKELRALIKPGDFLIGHSNGGLICYDLAWEFQNILGGVVLINPCIRRDTRFPPGLPVLCMANETDWVVSMGRWWGRLRDDNDGVRFTGWGAAGRYGLDQVRYSTDVKNIFTNDEILWEEPVRGHSGIFDDPEVIFWANFINAWINAWIARGR